MARTAKRRIRREWTAQDIRTQEALKEPNFRSGCLKGNEAHTRSAQAKGSLARASFGPSPLVQIFWYRGIPFSRVTF